VPQYSFVAGKVADTLINIGLRSELECREETIKSTDSLVN
jgi:hypothetical protein